MPQIWLTFDEMADAFGGSILDAKRGAEQNGLAYMKSSDGTKRVRLPPAMTKEYLSRLLTEANGGVYQPAHDMIALEKVVKAEFSQRRLPLSRLWKKAS